MAYVYVLLLQVKNTIHIQAKLLWEWGRGRSGLCDPIAQTVEAERFEELLETMHEALDSTFRELLASGDLPAFLRSHGWAGTDLPEARFRKNVRFDVPFDLQGVRTRDLEEALC